MKSSFKTGLSFGLTSGVITTLGLMVGLHSGTHSRTVVIGGILTIAIADAMSDALGMHIAEESKNNGVVSEIWESTIATFLAKFLIALTFVVPVLLLPLEVAMMVSVGWGLTARGAELLLGAGPANPGLESHRGACRHRRQRHCGHALRGRLGSLGVGIAGYW